MPYSPDTPYLVRRLIWLRLKYAVLRRDGYVCQDCGAAFGGRRAKIFDQRMREGRGGFKWVSLEVHHILPRSEGGSDHPGNLKTLCPECHRRYTTELMSERRDEKKRDQELLRLIEAVPADEEAWDHRGE